MKTIMYSVGLGLLATAVLTVPAYPAAATTDASGRVVILSPTLIAEHLIYDYKCPDSDSDGVCDLFEDDDRG
jgi:hypothetical protein